MTDDERASAVRLARLRAELAADRALMASCLADAHMAIARLATNAEDRAVAALAAVALHGWYTGLECALERVARQLDGDVPTGARWHRELLTQMSIDVPQVRPAILPAGALPLLTELLGFRQLFRHAYGVVLETPQLDARLATLTRVATDVDAALTAFDAFLVDAAASLVP